VRILSINSNNVSVPGRCRVSWPDQRVWMIAFVVLLTFATPLEEGNNDEQEVGNTDINPGQTMGW